LAELTIFRLIHVLAVVLWIGGVAFVTLVVMPTVRASAPEDERMHAFHRIESHFAPQARWWVALAGLSGLWMVHRGAMWGRFLEPRFWWMHAMVALWLLFMLMLFVIEPLLSHERLVGTADPARAFTRLERMHRLALLAAVVTIAGAVAGSHGLI
jgi:uncharacterized membrane protein